MRGLVEEVPIEDEVVELVGSVDVVRIVFRDLGFFDFLCFLGFEGVGELGVAIEVGVMNLRASGADEGSKEGSVDR